MIAVSNIKWLYLSQAIPKSTNIFFFLIMGQNLEKLSPQREVCRDKKPSQKRKERMRRPLTNIYFSGHNWVKSFLFFLNLHIYGAEKWRNMSDKTNKQKYSFRKDVNTVYWCGHIGRAGDFLLNISLTFNILPHVFFGSWSVSSSTQVYRHKN